MSIVSTWILADDGLYYKDPALRGVNWYICFDDTDPPELVVKVNDDRRKRSLNHIRRFLLNIGILPTYIEYGCRALRFFKTLEEKPDLADVWFFRIKRPIPVFSKATGNRILFSEEEGKLRPE
jgi:hypothetical protein